MQGLSDLAKLLVGLGLAIVVAGAALYLISRLLPRQGWLPGDIVVRKPGFTFYFPVVTSLIVSAVLSLLYLLIAWLRR